MGQARQIRLYGGPMHGQKMVLENDRDHFHILMPVMGKPQYISTEAELTEAPRVPVREGMYSQVGPSNDFEWDGWRSHD